MEEEIWKDINGYKHKYKISNYGNIKSLAYGKEKILSTRLGNGKYLKTNLSIDGKIHTVFIHRLVDEYFLKKDINKLIVNHKDCDKLNNNINNLEWCTAQENSFHAKINGRLARGERNGNRKLTSEKVKEIRKLYAENHSLRYIACKFSVSHVNIGKIVRNKTWI